MKRPPKCHVCGEELTTVVELEVHPKVFYHWSEDIEKYEGGMEVDDLDYEYQCPNCGSLLSKENFEFFHSHVSDC